MKYTEFETETRQMIDKSKLRIDLGVSFCLYNENRRSPSIVNTVEVLLILEQLYGRKFINNRSLQREFDFQLITEYLVNEAKELLYNDNKKRNATTRNVAFCGIGLLLLNETSFATEMYDLLLEYKIDDEYSWGVELNTRSPELFSTYHATRFINRMHKNVIKIPEWIMDQINHSNHKGGIAFSPSDDLPRSMEALTIALYMCKYYYCIPYPEDLNYEINSYFANKTTAICRGRQHDFPDHPDIYFKVFTFGLAAQLLKRTKNPFFIIEGRTIFQSLNRGFTSAPKNIPFVLELCRMLSAVKDSYDPFEDVLPSSNNVSVEDIVRKAVLTITIVVSLLCIVFLLIKLIIDAAFWYVGSYVGVELLMNASLTTMIATVLTSAIAFLFKKTVKSIISLISKKIIVKAD